MYGFTSTHQVFVNPSAAADHLLMQPRHTSTPEPVQYALITRCFGAPDTPEFRVQFDDAAKGLLAPIDKTYLNDAGATAAIMKGNVPKKAFSFVTFSADKTVMKKWEQSANIRVIEPDSPGRPGSVEASLEVLVRDFGACISIPLLYCQDFLDRYTQLMDDLWKFDHDCFPMMVIGIPTWVPFKPLREGLAARTRLATEIGEFYRRVGQLQRGEPVDFSADMSDISHTALERNKVYDGDNWTFLNRGHMDLSLLWGQNANTQYILFWLFAYIYSNPSLLEKLREEVAPHIKLSQTTPPEIVSMDLPGLSRDCPLLKACIFETYRLTLEVSSIRYIDRPISVNDGGHIHNLTPGVFVSVAHCTIQRDPAVYADPDKFVADRFLEKDAESGNLVPRYGKLRPWGYGPAMCRGRTFAEKELLSISACIMSLWDISPANGTWNLPAMIPGTGVKKPVGDLRVVVKRRVF